MIYSSDLETVLQLFSKNLAECEGNLMGYYDFFYACLDRIDILLTEKDSLIGKE